MKKIGLLLLVLLLPSCNSEKEKGQVFEETMFVMGTVVTVTLYGVEEQRSQKLFHDLLTDFKYMQAAWHPWKEGSLGRINSLLPHQAPFSIGPALKTMILQATEYSNQSEGYFNPAIGKLIKLWQFNQDELPTGPPPSEAEIKAIIDSKPNMNDLQITELNLQSKNPNVILDFGAFAKGYGVDKAIEYLKSMGVENAIVNAGGDLRAIGKKGNKPWMIGIRDPRAQSILAGIEVQGDESVFTSGDYERFYEYQGKRYHHILNPKTGYPTTNVRSVTIVHKSAALADAAATALFVAGPENWERVAKRMGVDQVMLIDDQGTIFLTPAIEKRIKFEKREGLNIKVSREF